MDRLIGNLLYFSELGNEKSAIQSCDPNAMIQDIEKMMSSLLKEKNARIIIPSPLPNITCDNTRITEVFRNLITNGVKYNDKKEPLIEVGFLKSMETPKGGEENVFYVRDNGIGIEPKNHQAIFAMFKKLRPSTDKKSSGVGLAFVKEIIERHKGRVWLESEVGKGSTFYFTIGEK
jgi:light-regulated signal transduction histidine kinase (bacteriophytochrome)